MEQVLIDSYVIDSLTHYGKGVNTERQLATIDDGLKVVYRRVIYTAMQMATKLMKTAAIAGNVIATVHPHSADSVADVVSALVRWGVFEGQGNHGMKLIYGANIYPSAPRYTEAKVSDKWQNIFSDLLPYVPYREAEMEGNTEPEYLPTPLPMILLFAGQSISYGVNARYPMFTANSLYEALIHNDPTYLEAPNGLILDSKSELYEIWNTGLGRLNYRFEVNKTYLESGDGVMISGSAELFKPQLEIEFEEELNKGQVYIIDQTAGDIPAVFVGRSPYVRAITQDDIYDRCYRICEYQKTFRLTVTDGNQAYVIPMKDWLEYTYDNYCNLIEIYKADKIDKLNFDYLVYKWLPEVTNQLLSDRDATNEQILSRIQYDHKKEGEIDLTLDIIKAILRKSISTLRNTDSTSIMDKIQEKIKEFESLDPVNYIKAKIDEF